MRDDLTDLPDGPMTCSVDANGSIAACRTLSASVQTVNGHGGRGVACWSYVNMTSESVRQDYGVKSGGFSKKGLVFNHCPFCGVDYRRNERGRPVSTDLPKE